MLLIYIQSNLSRFLNTQVGTYTFNETNSNNCYLFKTFKTQVLTRTNCFKAQIFNTHVPIPIRLNSRSRRSGAIPNLNEGLHGQFISQTGGTLTLDTLHRICIYSLTQFKDTFSHNCIYSYFFLSVTVRSILFPIKYFLIFAKNITRC